MTDVTSPFMTLEPLGPGPTYTRINIWLPQLYIESARAGSQVIENRRFEGCLFEGPAVIIPVGRCEFNGCELGDPQGDPRSLMLAPMGANRVVGPIAFRGCQFINCRFFGVGFTGEPAFLEELVKAIGGGSVQ